MRKTVLARGVLGVSIGLPMSLIVGTGASYLPDSPIEGLFAGIVVSSVLIVAVMVALSWAMGSGPIRKRLFDIHSFLGLATGIVLVVIVFSGALLLFRGDIETWSHDWMKVQPDAQFASVDAWLDSVAAKINLRSTDRVDIAWPKSLTAPVEIRVSGPEGFRKFHVDPYRAHLLEGELSTWMDWVRELHTNLHLKRTGHVLTGLTGLGAVWLVISGLFMRLNLFRDWRVLRFRMGSRIFIGDLHMRLASWLFPFIVLIAFSGMLLAFFEELSAGPVRILFEGSRGEMYTALGYPQRIPRSEQVVMPSLDSFTRIAKSEMPDARVIEVRVIGFGDRNAIVTVRASRENDLAPRGTSLAMHFHAVTHDVMSVRRIDEMGIFERFHAAMVALHVANFDEPAIRIFYASASIGLTLLPILGVFMWLQRRRHGRALKSGRAPKARL